MSANVFTLIEPVEGCRSDEGARFLAQLRDAHARLREAIAGLSREDLSWQHEAGFNTIGMLLAHVAVTEVHLTHVGIRGEKDSRVSEVLGIGQDDDGMPAPPKGAPPAALAGKDLAFYLDLLERAGRESEQAIRGLAAHEFDRRIVRPRPDGGERVLNVRWTVSHMLEHQTLHRGQIGLLRHLRQARVER